VLVNFWTLTCINWLRQAPWIRAWWRAYRDDGLLVVGVHTPEFSFEHDPALVRRAVAERRIDYPVAVDNHAAIWRAFDNRFWPALYFADRDGAIRDFHVGEGRYEESERALQRLLGVDRPLSTVEGHGVEAAADWEQLRTPEIYLGGGADPGRTYLHFNQWGTAGTWTADPEKIVLAEPGGSIACHFQAREVQLVVSPGAGQPQPFGPAGTGQAAGHQGEQQRGHGVAQGLNGEQGRVGEHAGDGDAAADEDHAGGAGQKR
jgi:hypothetical protein